MEIAEKILAEDFDYQEEPENESSPIEFCEPALLDKLEHAIEEQHFNSRTEQNYRHWINRFIIFNNLKSPTSLSQRHVKAFFLYLATKLRVSKAKLNQARLAIDFFYEEVLQKPIAPAAIC
jgi:hypothetical protein